VGRPSKLFFLEKMAFSKLSEKAKKDFKTEALLYNINKIFFQSKAATPGNTFPSIYSSKAPPPVET
jgi:hypothetical protein